MSAEPPGLALYAVIGTGRAAHLLRELAAARDGGQLARAVCGARGILTRRIDADERAAVAGGTPVCGNCRDQLAFSPGVAMLRPTEPTTRRRARRENTTMTTKQKAASVPLIEPDAYATTDVERLKAERLTINNRISGLKTRLKRAGGSDAQVEARLADMVSRRGMIGDQIAARAGDLAEATQEQASTAALAAATEDAAAELETPPAAEATTDSTGSTGAKASRTPAKRASTTGAKTSRTPAKKTRTPAKSASKATTKKASRASTKTTAARRSSASKPAGASAKTPAATSAE